MTDPVILCVEVDGEEQFIYGMDLERAIERAEKIWPGHPVKWHTTHNNFFKGIKECLK